MHTSRQRVFNGDDGGLCLPRVYGGEGFAESAARESADRVLLKEFFYRPLTKRPKLASKCYEFHFFSC